MIETLCTGSTLGKARCDQRVPHPVIGDAAAFFLAQNAALLFQPRDEASDCVVKSASVTASALRRVATMAASLTRLARSAPVKPAVSPATWSRSTPLSCRIFANLVVCYPHSHL